MLKRILIFILLTILISSFFACGRKGDPIVPNIVLPKTILDLKAQSLGCGIMLSWTLPAQNTDNTEITNLAYIEVWRKAADAEDVSKDWKKIANLSCKKFFEKDEGKENSEIDQVMSFFDEGENLVQKEEEKWFGKRFQYTVRNRTVDDDLSNPSNVVLIYPLKNPIPPTNITVTIEKETVKITWQEPTQNCQNQELEKDFIKGYNLYRAKNSDEFDPLPINSSPIKDSFHIDQSLSESGTYSYKVRAVSSERMPYSESLDSEIAKVEIIFPEQEKPAFKEETKLDEILPEKEIYQENIPTNNTQEKK